MGTVDGEEVLQALGVGEEKLIVDRYRRVGSFLEDVL